MDRKGRLPGGQKMTNGLAILSLLLCLNASAQQSTGDFPSDLGRVAGAIRAMASVKEICAESYPAYSKQNEAAYQEWRKKYLPFLQEIERYRLAAFVKQVKGDQAALIERANWWEGMVEMNKQAFRKRLIAAGPEAFLQTCQSYPAVYLQSDRGNLEHFYAEQVATLRKGDKPK